MSFYPDGVNRANLTAAGASSCAIHTPPQEADTAPGIQGTMQQVLMENLGQYVQIDFLVGVNTLVRRTGILYSVGQGYIVLYDESGQDFILCDAYSAKFISFYGAKPPAAALDQGMGVLLPDETGALRPAGAQGELDRVRDRLAALGTPRYFDRGAAAYPGARTLGDG